MYIQVLYGLTNIHRELPSRLVPRLRDVEPCSLESEDILHRRFLSCTAGCYIIYIYILSLSQTLQDILYIDHQASSDSHDRLCCVVIWP